MRAKTGESDNPAVFRSRTDSGHAREHGMKRRCGTIAAPAVYRERAGEMAAFGQPYIGSADGK
ncbi:hypothetical protein [Borborobacter arsenicus]|uniref:hypothetical protein n=1 Tax=Borborobacter arsenicus TaxID=1851146 RepID=UPI0014055513|nr:hypothetical protein [Pseudaminobacter arsenicus]